MYMPFFERYLNKKNVKQRFLRLPVYIEHRVMITVYKFVVHRTWRYEHEFRSVVHLLQSEHRCILVDTDTDTLMDSSIFMRYNAGHVT